MGMYWFKNQRSRADLQKDLEQLRKKNLKLRLDLFILVLTPNSKRAEKIQEEILFKAGSVGGYAVEEPKGEPAEVFFR